MSTVLLKLLELLALKLKGNHITLSIHYIYVISWGSYRFDLFEPEHTKSQIPISESFSGRIQQGMVQIKRCNIHEPTQGKLLPGKCGDHLFKSKHMSSGSQT